jgi:hypothetical protein
MKPVLSWPWAALLIVVVAGLAFVGGNRYAFKSGHRQGAKMPQLFADSRAATAPVMQEIAAKQTELDALLRGAASDRAAPNTAAIETLASEIGALQGKVYAERADLHARLTKAGLPVHPVRLAPFASAPGYGPAYAPATPGTGAADDCCDIPGAGPGAKPSAGSLPDCCQ